MPPRKAGKGGEGGGVILSSQGRVKPVKVVKAVKRGGGDGSWGLDASGRQWSSPASPPFPPFVGPPCEKVSVEQLPKQSDPLSYALPTREVEAGKGRTKSP